MRKYKVTLTEEERGYLTGIIRKGKNSAHVIRRARILLKADEGMKDQEIAEAVEYGGNVCQDKKLIKTSPRKNNL